MYMPNIAICHKRIVNHIFEKSVQTTYIHFVVYRLGIKYNINICIFFP